MSIKLPEFLQKELDSLKAPPPKDVAPLPVLGDKAPVSDKVKFDGQKPTIVVFLRHCGCPFALKTFRLVTALSSNNKDVRFVAVSQGDPAATEAWVVEAGGEWSVEVVSDPDRDAFAKWGLGPSTTWHTFNPWTLRAAWLVSREEGTHAHAAGGSRWQTSGAFAVDKDGFVRWVAVADAADHVPDLKAALAALQRPNDASP